MSADSDSAVGSGGGGGDAEAGARRGALGDGFRVRVCLERFFSDERARVLVWAERARPAGWLLRRLRAALPLPDAALALVAVAAGCLLPPDEPLAVLRPDDLIQVIISPCSRGEEEGAVEEAEVTTCYAEGEDGELEAVKRHALRLLEAVAARGQREAAPRRRRRARRRRPGIAPTPARWRAEHAGVVRAASPPRAARLVSAAH